MALYKSGQSGDSFPESAVTLVKFIDVDNDYSLYDVEINNIDDVDEDKEKLINF